MTKKERQAIIGQINRRAYDIDTVRISRGGEVTARLHAHILTGQKGSRSRLVGYAKEMLEKATPY